MKYNHLNEFKENDVVQISSCDWFVFREGMWNRMDVEEQLEFSSKG
jgi:hypothetical protein